MNDVMLCLLNLNFLFDYDWCEANRQWSFGWPPTYLYEWVDVVQD